MQPQARSLNSKLRLPCSYGGRIMLFPPAKTLQYVGGETRIVTVPRGISFSTFFVLLSGELLSSRCFSIKYRLPGCDLDALITVGNNEDLQNMIVEYDSATSRRIRLFLFPLAYPQRTRYPVSVKQLLGLEPPFQKIPFTSSSYLLPIPAKRVGQGNIDATAEEARMQDEAPKTSASWFPSENAAAADAGRDSDKETERVEIQDQSGLIVQQEPLICISSDCYIYSTTYVPVWPMQAHLEFSGKRDLN